MAKKKSTSAAEQTSIPAAAERKGNKRKKKSHTLEELKNMRPEDRAALGLTEEAVAPVTEATEGSDNKVPSAEKVKIPDVVPANSYLRILAEYSWRANSGLRRNFGNLEAYIKDILEAINDPNHPNFQAYKESFVGLSPDIALQAMSTQEISSLVNSWIESDTDDASRKQSLLYKEHLIRIGTLPKEEKNFAPKEKLKLKEDPKYSYDNGFIKAEFVLIPESGRGAEENPQKLEVRIPKLAQVDLENQKPVLEKAFLELMQSSNFRKRPFVEIEPGGQFFNFYFGDASNKVVGLKVRTERIQNALETKAKLPKASAGEKLPSLDDYKNAKQFLTDNPWDKAKDQADRNKIIAANEKIKVFQRFVFGLGARDHTDRVSIMDYARNQAFEQIWRKLAGEEKIKELEQKDPGPENKTKPAPDTAKPEAKADKKAAEPNLWRDPLPDHDPEFKVKADKFRKEIEDYTAQDWKNLLGHFSQQRRDKNDQVYSQAVKNGLSVIFIVRLAAEKLLAGQPESAKEFAELAALEDGRELKKRIGEILKHDLPQGLSRRGEFLRAYLLNKIPPDKKPAADADTNGRKPHKEDRPRVEADEHENESPDADNQEDEDDSADNQSDSNEGNENEPINFDHAWNYIKGLLNKHGEISQQLLEEGMEFVDDDELQEFLEAAIKQMGFWPTYEAGLKEYKVESSIVYLIRAVNVYSKIPDKEQTGAKEKLGTSAHKPADAQEKPKSWGEYFQTEGQYPEFVVSKHGLTGGLYFTIPKGDDMPRLPLPEKLDFSSDETRKKLVAGVESLIKENPKFDFTTLVSGSLEPKANSGLELTLTLKGQAAHVKILAKDFVNNPNLLPSDAVKPVHNPLFKLLLVERLRKYQSIEAKDMKPEDKEQLNITEKTLRELLAAPHGKGYSFIEQAQAAAVLESLAHKEKPKKEQPEKTHKEEKQTDTEQPGHKEIKLELYPKEEKDQATPDKKDENSDEHHDDKKDQDHHEKKAA